MTATKPGNPASKPNFDLHEIIKAAKLGRMRKDAQEDTCSVFAAALFDVLSARDIPCSMVTVSCSFTGMIAWYHAVIDVDGRYYDSMGEFSEEIWRKRAKIHPTVRSTLVYKPDTRVDCYDDEFEDLHQFYLKALSKAF